MMIVTLSLAVCLSLWCEGYFGVCVCLQQEQTEWDAMNRLLQHQGFKPVRFADPTENKNLAGIDLFTH